MTIAPCGTFDYRGTVSADFVNSPAIKLVQSPLPDESLSSEDFAYRRLIGFYPTLEFGDDLAVIRATSRDHTECLSFSFGLHDQIRSVIKPEDVIYISRTDCAGLGLSIIRDDSLIVGLGAIRSVPLGQLAAFHSPKVRDWTSNEIPEKHENHFLEFVFGEDENCRVYDGELISAHDYSIYLRNTFLRTLPGVDECVFIASKNHVSDQISRDTVEHFLNLNRIEDWPDVKMARESAIQELNAKRDDRSKQARKTLQEYLRNQPAPNPDHPFFADD